MTLLGIFSGIEIEVQRWVKVELRSTVRDVAGGPTISAFTLGSGGYYPPETPFPVRHLLSATSSLFISDILMLVEKYQTSVRHHGPDLAWLSGHPLE